MSPLTTPVAASTWLDALVESATDVATGPLGFESMEVVARSHEVPADARGSYIALVGEEQSVQIGLVASGPDCARLAGALLAVAAGESVGDADVSDAVGELVNILGGGVKRRISARHPGFRLGLPLFVQGRLMASDHQECCEVAVRLGPVPAHLVVIRRRGE